MDVYTYSPTLGLGRTAGNGSPSDGFLKLLPQKNPVPGFRYLAQFQSRRAVGLVGDYIDLGLETWVVGAVRPIAYSILYSMLVGCMGCQF